MADHVPGVPITKIRSYRPACGVVSLGGRPGCALGRKVALHEERLGPLGDKLNASPVQVLVAGGERHRVFVRRDQARIGFGADT